MSGISGVFPLSEQSLAVYANVTKRTVCTAIKKLMDQGLIVRSKEKHPKYRTYEYTVSDEVRRKYFNKDGEIISPMSVKKVHQEQSKIFTDAGEKTSPNNIVHSAIDNPRYKEDPSRVKRENCYGTNSNPALDVCNPAEYIRH